MTKTPRQKRAVSPPATPTDVLPQPGADEEVIWGLCHFHSETGTEGGYWAVQDVRGISHDGARWSYYGLHILEDGERLTVFAPESVTPGRRDGERTYGPEWTPVVRWNGTIERTVLPEKDTEGAFGWRIHFDQAGLDRPLWARYFFDELPCRLVRSTTQKGWPPGPRVIGELPVDGTRYEGLTENGSPPRSLFFMEDGSVRWAMPKAEPLVPTGARAHLASLPERPAYRLLHTVLQRQAVRDARSSAADVASPTEQSPE